MSEVDPKLAFFTVPTIADDMAPLEPCLVLDEDRWRQIEFFDARRQDEIKRILRALKAYVSEHTQGQYWNGCYARELAPAPVVAGASALREVEAALGKRAGAAALITSILGKQTMRIGRIVGGFTFSLGEGVHLYGFADDDGIQVLCAHVDVGADNAVLARAFSALNEVKGLILVDWQSQALLNWDRATGQINVWRP